MVTNCSSTGILLITQSCDWLVLSVLMLNMQIAVDCKAIVKDDVTCDDDKKNKMPECLH